MIDKLEKLTMSQFVDLVCGDTDVLLHAHEVVSKDRLAKAMRDIVFEYREIADKAAASRYISSMERLLKARIAIVFFTMCKNLVTLGAYDKARDLMCVYGVGAMAMNDRRLSAEIKSRLGRARQTVERIEEERQKENSDISDIRNSFDEQTAAMMSYFKFQIDTSTMKATIYAHLVARFNREIKAQVAALRKK